MDFALSPEQRLMEESFLRYLDEAVPIEDVRKRMQEDDPAARDLWRSLAELGAAGVLIPEEHGGSGLGLLDAALLSETFGRRVTPAPLLASAVMVPVAIAATADTEAAARWLPGIATGAERFAVALPSPGLPVEIARDRLQGEASTVIDAAGCDRLLVVTGESRLAVIAADATAVSLERRHALDETRRIARARLDGAPVLCWLAGGESMPHAVLRMLDAGRIALAADMLGAADEMIRQAVEYAQQREQFGRPIGSFQAVKHLCAEMVAALEPARSLLWYAAHAWDELPEEAPLMAAHVKAHIGDIARDIARTSTEVHGGVGFTDEQNLHVWLKRIELSRWLLGRPEELRERAARLQGWAA